MQLFRVTGDVVAVPFVIQANRWQAIHIPLALADDIEAARNALNKARHAAEMLGRAGRLEGELAQMGRLDRPF